MVRDLDLGKYLTLGDFCECTDTYKAFADSIDPLPQSPRSLESLRFLAEHLLDPLIDHYGLDAFQLTYGFCSSDLRRKLTSTNPATGKPFGRVAPSIDQHVAEELGSSGRAVCKRGGAAADFRIKGISSRTVISWILDSALPFDRLYFYGDDRAIHLSYGPGQSRYLCAFSAANIPEQKSIRDLVLRARQVYQP